jgi:hypothetical protein
LHDPLILQRGLRAIEPAAAREPISALQFQSGGADNRTRAHSTTVTIDRDRPAVDAAGAAGMARQMAGRRPGAERLRSRGWR